MQQQDVELHYFDVPSPHFESSVGPPEGVSDLREALQEASECSVVLGGPLDPDNHFDRALTAGLSFTSHHCPSPMRFPSSLPPVRCPQVPTARVPGALIAKRLRAAVQEQLHFTCSAGIAHNKILAKLGSSLNKPNKQAIILPRGVHDMMQARCWGQECFETAPRALSLSSATISRRDYCVLNFFCRASLSQRSGAWAVSSVTPWSIHSGPLRLGKPSR